jgi:hypothetical protein
MDYISRSLCAYLLDECSWVAMLRYIEIQND